MSALAITDHGVISGHVQMHKEAKKADIKPILGIEWYITTCLSNDKSAESRSRSHHMVCLAKNYNSWKRMIKAVSHSNDVENFYYKPRLGLNSGKTEGHKALGLDYWCENGDFICISGHSGSLMSEILWCNPFDDDPKEKKQKIRTAYSKPNHADPEHHRQFLIDNWFEQGCKTALMLEKIIGKGNFFIELQNEYNSLDRIPLTFQPIEVECLRAIAKETGIPAVCSGDPHYAKKEDASMQRMMLMNNMGTTVDKVEAQINSQDDNDLMAFYGSDEFYIHSYDEMKLKYTREEIDNSNKISDMVEEFDIYHEPYIPKAQITINIDLCKDKIYDICKTDQDKELMYLTIEGAKKLKPWENPEWKNKLIKKFKIDYWNQITEELEMIFKYGLSDYILLTLDYCMFCKNAPADGSFDWRENLKNNGPIKSIPIGDGRGSVGGSLVCYLIGITGKNIDPLLRGLKFYRFINPGRFTEGVNSLADIDIDVCRDNRDRVIDYLKWRYGEDKVSQVITFGKIAGRAAIKDTFRVEGVKDHFEKANEITKMMPLEGSIISELEEARKEQENDDYGMINWCMDNMPEFREKCNQNEYTELIDKSIRMESTLRNSGKHASAIIISPEPLDSIYPMVLDTKTKKKIVGFSHKESEELGSLKADILGLSALSKINKIKELISESQ